MLDRLFMASNLRGDRQASSCQVLRYCRGRLLLLLLLLLLAISQSEDFRWKSTDLIGKCIKTDRVKVNPASGARAGEIRFGPAGSRWSSTCVGLVISGIVLVGNSR